MIHENCGRALVAISLAELVAKLSQRDGGQIREGARDAFGGLSEEVGEIK